MYLYQKLIHRYLDLHWMDLLRICYIFIIIANRRVVAIGCKTNPDNPSIFRYLLDFFWLIVLLEIILSLNMLFSFANAGCNAGQPCLTMASNGTAIVQTACKSGDPVNPFLNRTRIIINPVFYQTFPSKPKTF